MLASLVLILTLTLSCISIDEEHRAPAILHDNQGLFTFFKDIYRSIRHLPQQIRAVCYIQFFAWIGKCHLPSCVLHDAWVRLQKAAAVHPAARRLCLSTSGSAF